MQTSGQKGKGASGQSNWPALRKRLFDMVSVGVINDPLNKGYDIVSTAILIINLVVSVMLTFDELSVPYGGILLTIEKITVAFFAVDYVLRFITAKLLYTEYSEPKAILRYVFSMAGIVDLLSFLPYYLPVFFPSGAVAFSPRGTYGKRPLPRGRIQADNMAL
jgi:voltage-gated potassium channel